MRQAAVLCLAVIAGSGALGCGSPAAPARIPQSPPSPQPTSTAPPVPASNPSNAMVTIDDPFAIVFRDGPHYGYRVRFLLRETGGASGAVIERVVVYGPSGSNETDAGCWRGSLRVPANGALDTFYTDAGADWLLYCAPGADGDVATPSLYVVVAFKDDNGVGGSVGVPVSTLR